MKGTEITLTYLIPAHFRVALMAFPLGYGEPPMNILINTVVCVSGLPTHVLCLL